MPTVAVKGRIRFVANASGRASFMESWARVASAAGHTVQESRSPETVVELADFALIEGPVAGPLPLARQSFVIDDGSPGPILANRLRKVAGTAILCPDPERQALLAAQGLAARALAPALDSWRWTRPIRPAWPQTRIVVATDAAAGRLSGLASLPLPDAESDTDARYAPSVQAVVLILPEQRLFHALTALATGLPLVLSPQGLRWLGPLAALRCAVDEAPAELLRLASDPAAWLDQVQQGLDALKRNAHPARFLDDLAALMGS